MSKSNIRSIRNRKYNNRQFMQERNRRNEKIAPPKHSRMNQLLNRLHKWFFGKTSISLDLTHKQVFRSDQKRDAGAAWLRTVFGQSLDMVSTRDGKRI